MPGSQSNHDGGRIGQGHLPDNGRPARVRRPLQTKEEEDTAKEAFNGTAFAQFLACLQVGGRQERFFCRLGFQGTTAMAPSVAWIQWMS
jgi:hypothetical protein